MNRYNEHGDKHGYWEEYYDIGKLSYKGNYKNGIRDGYWESYHSTEVIESKNFYL